MRPSPRRSAGWRPAAWPHSGTTRRRRSRSACGWQPRPSRREPRPARRRQPAESVSVQSRAHSSFSETAGGRNRGTVPMPFERHVKAAGVGSVQAVRGRLIALTVLICLWLGLGFGLSLITRLVADWFVMTDELLYERLAISVARTHS